MKSWTLVYEAFDPEKESLREALCTLGNGYFATRGAAPESEAESRSITRARILPGDTTG